MCCVFRDRDFIFAWRNSTYRKKAYTRKKEEEVKDVFFCYFFSKLSKVHDHSLHHTRDTHTDTQTHARHWITGNLLLCKRNNREKFTRNICVFISFPFFIPNINHEVNAFGGERPLSIKCRISDQLNFNSKQTFLKQCATQSIMHDTDFPLNKIPKSSTMHSNAQLHTSAHDKNVFVNSIYTFGHQSIVNSNLVFHSTELHLAP